MPSGVHLRYHRVRLETCISVVGFEGYNSLYLWDRAFSVGFFLMTSFGDACVGIVGICARDSKVAYSSIICMVLSGPIGESYRILEAIGLCEKLPVDFER